MTYRARPLFSIFFCSQFFTINFQSLLFRLAASCPSAQCVVFSSTMSFSFQLRWTEVKRIPFLTTALTHTHTYTHTHAHQSVFLSAFPSVLFFSPLVTSIIMFPIATPYAIALALSNPVLISFSWFFYLFSLNSVFCSITLHSPSTTNIWLRLFTQRTTKIPGTRHLLVEWRWWANIEASQQCLVRLPFNGFCGPLSVRAYLASDL